MAKSKQKSSAGLWKKSMVGGVVLMKQAPGLGKSGNGSTGYSEGMNEPLPLEREG